MPVRRKMGTAVENNKMKMIPCADDKVVHASLGGCHEMGFVTTSRGARRNSKVSPMERPCHTGVTSHFTFVIYLP